MTQFDDLMQVQEHDSAIDRLRHRRANLPELAELARIEDELAEVERAMDSVTLQRDEIARREKRLEGEVSSLEAKISEVDARMYSGAVTIPRELQAMQAEVESMRRRCSVLEDDILEAMTEREPLDAAVARLQASRAQLDEDGARLRTAVAEIQASIDADLALEAAAREAAALGLPSKLEALYEQLRTKLDGVGAARLANGRCGGCHLTLPASEIDRIRREPPEAMIQCDQCGRILVR